MIDRESRLVTEAVPNVNLGLGKVAMVEQPRVMRLRMLRAFTLIELMVAVGILVLLAGLLIPAISHSYKQAQIQAQQLEFQTIASALENYNKDFGAYPSNSSLPTWAVSNTTLNPSNGTGPHFLSLGLALLGPGPVTAGPGKDSNGNSITLFGDGADGPGFRVTSLDIVSAPSPSATSLASSVTLNTSVPPSWDYALPASYNKAIFTNDEAFVILSPGSQTEEKVPVSAATGNTIYLGKFDASAGPPAYTSQPYALFFAHNTTDNPPILKTASGKVWQGYLPDTMKFQWDTSAKQAEPVLLDHWGGIIQYFSRFGSNSTNRLGPVVGGVATNSSATPPAVTPTAGPLYGYCTPKSIEFPYNNNPTFPVGGNTIWDSRDGADWPAAAKQADVNKNYNSWVDSAPTTSNGVSFEPTWAFKWMLGDDDFNNFIGPNETLRYDGPYILISAGSSGHLCNFRQLFVTTGTNPSSGTYPTAIQCQSFYTASGNIYNFSR